MRSFKGVIMKYSFLRLVVDLTFSCDVSEHVSFESVL